MTGAFAVVPVSMTTVAAAKTPVIREDPLAPIAQRAVDALAEISRSGSLEAQLNYELDRHAIAVVIAERLAVDVNELEAAWRKADVAHQTAMMAAFSQLGTPYRHNTSKPGVGFDCSGLTTYAWAQAGITLTRQSSSQISAAAKRTAETAQAGDLLFYPGHIMMWIGVSTAMVHSPGSGRTVEVDFVSKSRQSLRYGDPVG